MRTWIVTRRGMAAVCWAFNNGEWWPATIHRVDEETGTHHVSFIGWGKRHDVALPASMVRIGEHPRRLCHAMLSSLESGLNGSKTPLRKDSEPPPRLKLKVAIPDEFECTACGGHGTAPQMIQCRSTCGGWVHRCCAGRAETASHPPRADAAEDPMR